LTIATPRGSDLGIASVENPRVRFYLDNYKIIETWAQLRTEAIDTLQELLTDLVDVLAADAVQHNEPDLIVRADDSDTRRPRITMLRRGWQDSANQVPAAVVIEWYNPIINKDGDLHLYVGIRVQRQAPRGARIANQLSRLAPELRSQLGKPWQREAESFPLWRWIEPDGDRLDEIDLLEQARTAAWQCWALAAPHLETVNHADL
jgi:hypothetical protein